MTAARARRGLRGDSLRIGVYAGPDPVTGKLVYLRERACAMPMLEVGARRRTGPSYRRRSSSGPYRSIVWSLPEYRRERPLTRRHRSWLLEESLGMGLIIRAAQMDDVPAMGRLAVATFLATHRGHIPAEVWAKRRDEWSAEDSARNWARTLRAIADGTNPRECVYLAVDETCDEVIGIAMGQPAHEEPWPNTGAIKVLYVLQTYQGRGLGRRLVRVVAHQLRRIGMPALTVAVLKANVPAQRFYEAIGGQPVGVGEIEDSGFMLPEIVYGWADTETLIAAAGLEPDRS